MNMKQLIDIKFLLRLIAQSVDGVCVPTQGVASSASTFNSNIHIIYDPINVQMFSLLKIVLITMIQYLDGLEFHIKRNTWIGMLNS